MFRTSEGTKLSGASEEAPVALEADGVDPNTGLAWSVAVKGTAAVVTGTEQVLETTQLFLFPWQGGKKDIFVRNAPDSITGRRLKVTEPVTWRTQLSGAVRTARERPRPVRRAG